MGRACKIRHASCGGVTHWAITDDDDGGTMTVAWGQNAVNGLPVFPSCGANTDARLGELGFGPNEPKSSTKPIKNQPLSKIDVFKSVLYIFTLFISFSWYLLALQLAKTRLSSSPNQAPSYLICRDTPLM